MKKLLIVVDFQNDFVNGSLGFDGAKNIEENIVARIKKFEEDNGGALRFGRTIPEKPKGKDNSEPFYGDMIFGI